MNIKRFPLLISFHFEWSYHFWVNDARHLVIARQLVKRNEFWQLC